MFRFEEFSLDPDKGELRRDGALIELEPQVFRLLLLLVESEGRLISRDELLQEIWHGRIVSDSAISSRIKALRKALGDDGKQQRLLRTVPKRGFRFVAPIVSETSAPLPLRSAPVSASRPAEPSGTDKVARADRPSIAVLPFAAQSDDELTAILAAALPDELITELARLRWLFIIARGSSFRFHSYASDPQQVRDELGVRYCLSGAARTTGNRTSLSIELTDLSSGSVVWSERYEGDTSDVGALREQIKHGVVSAMELEIPYHEAQRAQVVDPEQLSTWASYHLGLQHLNRFTARDLETACEHFRRAIELEPGFARAHAALSAAHFQVAFQRLSRDEGGDSRLAREHAQRGVELDAQDPFANFVMGRVHWLEDDVPSSQGWLERAILLSPSSAKSHYAQAWSDSILGNFREADERVSLALDLSPLDPFRYGMLGVHAFNAVWERDFARAANWSREAAAAPGAHALIALIAVAAHQLDGRREDAQHWADVARKRHAGVTRQHFFSAFPFADPDLQQLFAAGLAKHGF